MEGIVLGVGGAALTGLTGSLHCALMCGPLACAGLPRDSKWTAALGWQLGRVLAYSAVGAALGFAGRNVAKALARDIEPVLPWVMAAGLVFTALDLGRHLKPLPGISRIASLLSSLARPLSPAWRSTLLGAATPFLPCGLLYGMLLAAAAAGSGPGGALILGAFALGGVPALLTAQLGSRLWVRSPKWAVLRSGALLVAAAVLVWRAVQAQQGPPHCH